MLKYRKDLEDDFVKKPTDKSTKKQISLKSKNKSRYPPKKIFDERFVNLSADYKQKQQRLIEKQYTKLNGLKVKKQ